MAKLIYTAITSLDGYLAPATQQTGADRSLERVDEGVHLASEPSLVPQATTQPETVGNITIPPTPTETSTGRHRRGFGYLRYAVRG